MQKKNGILWLAKLREPPLSSLLKIAVSSGIPSKKNTTDSRVQTLCPSKLHVPGSHGNVYWPKISGRGGGGNAFTNKTTTDVSIPFIYHGKIPQFKGQHIGKKPIISHFYDCGRKSNCESKGTHCFTALVFSNAAIWPIFTPWNFTSYIS